MIYTVKMKDNKNFVSLLKKENLSATVPVLFITGKTVRIKTSLVSPQAKKQAMPLCEADADASSGRLIWKMSRFFREDMT